MAQNIYDSEGFFVAYSGLRRSVEGWTARQSGRHCARCCRGCRVAALSISAAATDGSVAGPSRQARHRCSGSICRRRCSNVLLPTRLMTGSPTGSRTSKWSNYRGIVRGRLQLAGAALPASDLDRILGTVHRSLVPGGVFVFSIEHPIYSAPSHPEFVTDSSGHVTWPLDRYQIEGTRTTDWLAPGVQKYTIRTIATYVTGLLQTGFTCNSCSRMAADRRADRRVPRLVRGARSSPVPTCRRPPLSRLSKLPVCELRPHTGPQGSNAG
jgi:hypothetical protein